MNKKLDIIIPTRKRFKKLVRTLMSIPQYDYMELHIIADGDPDTHKKLMEIGNYWKGGEAQVHLIKHKGSVYARNLVTMRAQDAILWATDDIVFQRGAIESAWKNLKDFFPNGDGVVGFNQINARPPGNFCWTGVAIMGQTFLQRYPGKKISHPGYFHFGTREIEILADRKLGKLFKDRKAGIFHYHPDWFPEEMDETHYTARLLTDADMRLKKERREKGLIWGFGTEGAGAWKA